MRCVTTILATIPLLAAACASGSPPDEERPPRTPEPAAVDTVDLEPEPIRFDAPVRIEARRHEAIRHPDAWLALWREATAGTEPAPEPPPVDLDIRTILLAAAGEKPTGGYAVTIEAAHLIGDTLHVDVLERSPGQGCMTTQAITYPLAAVTVERVDAEARFHVRRETGDC